MNKKLSVAGLALASLAAVGFVACGDDSSNSSDSKSNGIEVTAKDLPSCTKGKTGTILIVDGEPQLCLDKEWHSFPCNEDDENATVKISESEETFDIYCGDNKVGSIPNTLLEKCEIEDNDSGYTLICDGEEIGSVSFGTEESSSSEEENNEEDSSASEETSSASKSSTSGSSDSTATSSSSVATSADSKSSDSKGNSSASNGSNSSDSKGNSSASEGSNSSDSKDNSSASEGSNSTDSKDNSSASEGSNSSDSKDNSSASEGSNSSDSKDNSSASEETGSSEDITYAISASSKVDEQYFYFAVPGLINCKYKVDEGTYLRGTFNLTHNDNVENCELSLQNDNTQENNPSGESVTITLSVTSADVMATSEELPSEKLPAEKTITLCGYKHCRATALAFMDEFVKWSSSTEAISSSPLPSDKQMSFALDKIAQSFIDQGFTANNTARAFTKGIISVQLTIISDNYLKYTVSTIKNPGRQ